MSDPTPVDLALSTQLPIPVPTPVLFPKDLVLQIMHLTHGRLSSPTRRDGLVRVVTLIQTSSSAASATTPAAFPHTLGVVKNLPTGRCLVHCLASRGHVTYLRLALARGAPPAPVDALGHTPLMYAARLGTASGSACVRALLAAGAPAHGADATGLTALMRAASAHAHDTIVALLAWARLGAREHRAFVNSRDRGGRTALVFAAKCGDLVSVKMLIAAGARLGVTYDGESVVEVATKFGHGEVAQWLREVEAGGRGGGRHALLLHREVVAGRDEYGEVERPVVPTG